MFTITCLWVAAVSLYGLFWLWYVGIKGKLSPVEVEQYMQGFEA